MEEILSQYIGEWGWLTVAAIFTFAFKDAITNFFKGVQFLWSWKEIRSTK